MVDHYEAQLQLRTKLLTLSVCTTGSISVAATTTGYTRATGSFITDGFRPGMEVTGTGFTNSENNAAKTITGVTATVLTCAGNVAESSASRTLSVGLPGDQAWENADFTPTDGSPWVEEQYLPGPMQRITLGSTAQLEVFPQYIARVYVPAGYGIGAARSYADALLTLFAPGTSFTMSSGSLRVRGDTAPFSGQLIQADPGFAVVPVTVPLRMRTPNSI